MHMKSLKAIEHELSVPCVQLQFFDQTAVSLPTFEEKLDEVGLNPLTSAEIETLQINLGKMCNQTCAHCHVDAGPDRTEIMSREILEACLEAVRNSGIPKVDLTGGAPEMNPEFRWFVQELSGIGIEILVRSNLTILTVNGKYRQLPRFYADHSVTVVSSLPCYTAENTDRQRGTGVFKRSIQAIRELNAVGYAQKDSGLELHLVYNPLGAFLPPPQLSLMADYKKILWEEYRILFNDLYCITNMPINRFLDSLISQGQYEQYMDTLIAAFNPEAARGVMCRNTISVGWDGTLYDCDFNQMLDLNVAPGIPAHILEFDAEQLRERPIVVRQHCFGCTAGAGSSCGGEIVR
jgi:radical SAM/Cys-rich protein